MGTCLSPESISHDNLTLLRQGEQEPDLLVEGDDFPALASPGSEEEAKREAIALLCYTPPPP